MKALGRHEHDMYSFKSVASGAKSGDITARHRRRLGISAAALSSTENTTDAINTKQRNMPVLPCWPLMLILYAEHIILPAHSVQTYTDSGGC
jgi:hypothetical protein